MHPSAMEIPSLDAVLVKAFRVYANQDFSLLSRFSVSGVNCLADVSFEMTSSCLLR